MGDKPLVMQNPARLAAVGHEFALYWELFEPWYGLRWWLKPWIARFRGSREPARFMLLTGRRKSPGE
jgi:hypothetical protein